jgi:hypothetical protein
MKRLTPMTRVHTALEKYFTKEVDIWIQSLIN